MPPLLSVVLLSMPLLHFAVLYCWRHSACWHLLTFRMLLQIPNTYFKQFSTVFNCCICDLPLANPNFNSLNFICDWSTREAHFAQLSAIIEAQITSTSSSDCSLPSVQPFHALVYPLSLSEMQRISEKYAQRAAANVAPLQLPPFRHNR
jgi:Glycosyl transferase family 41